VRGTTTPLLVRVRSPMLKPVTGSLKVMGIVLTLVLRGSGVTGAKLTVGGVLSIV
jgi:hypothetical protein